MKTRIQNAVSVAISVSVAVRKIALIRQSRSISRLSRHENADRPTPKPFQRSRFIAVRPHFESMTIPKVKKFKYLGSIIQPNGNIDENINQHLKVGWQKQKYASAMQCDRRMLVGLKGKIYRMVVKPAVLYGSECQLIKKTQTQRLIVAEMRMIRWMYGYTRMDRIRN